MVLSLYNWHKVFLGQHANKVYILCYNSKKYTYFPSECVCCGVIRMFITTTEQLYTSYNSISINQKFKTIPPTAVCHMQISEHVTV